MESTKSNSCKIFMGFQQINNYLNAYLNFRSFDVPSWSFKDFGDVLDSPSMLHNLPPATFFDFLLDPKIQFMLIGFPKNML